MVTTPLTTHPSYLCVEWLVNEQCLTVVNKRMVKVTILDEIELVWHDPFAKKNSEKKCFSETFNFCIQCSGLDNFADLALLYVWHIWIKWSFSELKLNCCTWNSCKSEIIADSNFKSNSQPTFLWALAAFSFIFCLVLVPEHFQMNALHITDNLAKNQF